MASDVQIGAPHVITGTRDIENRPRLLQLAQPLSLLALTRSHQQMDLWDPELTQEAPLLSLTFTCQPPQATSAVTQQIGPHQPECYTPRDCLHDSCSHLVSYFKGPVRMTPATKRSKQTTL